MTKPIINVFANLEAEFESVQKSLVDIDDNLKKITGKDPGRLYDDHKNLNRARPRSFNNENQRKLFGLKRKLNDFGENEEENLSKRSLQSQVVATSWETKHRNQVLEEQKNDKKTLSRNKRMFGFILGTLEKFKIEESQRRDSIKRIEIEKKIDQADEQEREAVKKEREELIKKRREKKLQMRCLEEKLQRVEIHKEWEKSQQSIGNFIETKAKPHIFYLPVKHTHETTKRLQETKDKYRIILAEKRAKVQKELNEIEDLFKRDAENDKDEEAKEEKVHTNLPDTSSSVSPIKKSTNENGNSEHHENKGKSHEKSASENDSKVTKDKGELVTKSNGDKKSKVKKDQIVELNGDKVSKVKEEDFESDKELGDKEFEPIYD